MYQLGVQTMPNKRRRKWPWILFLLMFLVLGTFLFMFVRKQLQPKTVINQSKTVNSKATYDAKIKHYEEGDFSIDLPQSWQPVARPAGPYKSFTWQSGDKTAGRQVIEIFEDTIPVNFAVNRAQIVNGELDRLGLTGAISDNCSTFTKGVTAKPGQYGVPAKWLGIDFLCDQSNTERNVVGVSSPDGVNFVNVKSPATGQTHKFLFSFTDYTVNPDYSVFTNALSSFRMQ